MCEEAEAMANTRFAGHFTPKPRVGAFFLIMENARHDGVQRSGTYIKCSSRRHAWWLEITMQARRQYSSRGCDDKIP